MTPLIIALDKMDCAQALALADTLDPTQCRVKVGKELFTREGPAVVNALHAKGFEVFLDLKFHDIPHTVAQAVEASADLGVWMVNVHAQGGPAMLEAAANRLTVGGYDTKLIAVTVLTSMSEQELSQIGIGGSLDAHVTRLAAMSFNAGLDGVVCSAHEASMIRQATSDAFLRVTPGIRPAFAAKNDQSRIMTPKQALDAGSTHLVVGRPVTQAEAPQYALERIIDELHG
ncbi:orotidine-5'-phosphate decarboxylase [Larsenimonas salina]|uniref:orotidine-5'-phosphate decarboxylase n=1 Tax=Larsenimonas salina TaxID=1295565 RepID=UPI00207388B0|nr:orotidine-5'-phosphate decarboxylase [Larsenimonas salina]MCM5703289.1 orotidine-5'-phosphate decarboxylase [Larsenimonas salina]